MSQIPRPFAGGVILAPLPLLPPAMHRSDRLGVAAVRAGRPVVPVSRPLDQTASAVAAGAMLVLELVDGTCQGPVLGAGGAGPTAMRRLEGAGSRTGPCLRRGSADGVGA